MHVFSETIPKIDGFSRLLARSVVDLGGQPNYVLTDMWISKCKCWLICPVMNTKTEQYQLVPLCPKKAEGFFSLIEKLEGTLDFIIKSHKSVQERVQFYMQATV